MGAWSSWGHRFNDSIIIIYIYHIKFILLKQLVTSVQVTNKYSNLQQTNQISVFVANIN